MFRKPYFCKVQYRTIASLVDFLKHQPLKPNSKQELVAWIYNYLIQESKTDSSERSNQNPFFEFPQTNIRIDASYPIRNEKSQLISISTPEFLLEIILLDTLTTKNQTKTVIQTIEQLEAVMMHQGMSDLTDRYEKPTPAYLLLLSTDIKQAYSQTPDYYSDKQLFSLHHGAYYSGNQNSFYHGKDMLKLQTKFEFEWRINHQANYNFCLTQLQLPLDFKREIPTNNTKLRLELPRGTYRDILANIAAAELNHRDVTIEELIHIFSKYTEMAFSKQLNRPEFQHLQAAEKQQLLDLAMNSFQGKGNSGACYAQIHIHTINDKHRIHFGGMKSPSADKNLFVILDLPNENQTKYGSYKKLTITAFNPEIHRGYDIFYGKKGDIQKTLS